MTDPSGLLAAARRLRIDAATAEIIGAFEDAGVASVLLKGPALAGWYADDPAHAYMDCDLWVRPGDAEAAKTALAGLGFGLVAYDGDLPAWWDTHAHAYSRDADGVVVDLHSTLQGLGVDVGTAWEILSSPRDTVPVAGRPVPALALPARVLYVTLHAAHHGQWTLKAVSHVERALSAVTESTWREAARLAQEVGSTEEFAAGLRLVPEGVALADRLGLPAPSSVKVVLQASGPPPVALGFEQLASADGLWARVDILARKIVPPPAFMRRWWPVAAENRRMLAVAYLYRPVWLVRRAPRGLRAWLRARRDVRS